MPSVIYHQLIVLLDESQASYRVIKHERAGRSVDAAKARGTLIEQGAKALVCHVKGNGVRQYILAVLPAHHKANLMLLAQQLGATRASLASPEEVMNLTQCVFGAIPPFSFHPELRLIVDPMLFELHDEIVFNAGSLEHSILLKVTDYKRITNPTLLKFSDDVTG